MHAPVVILGIGELAGVFAHGFLRRGHPVYPVTRDTDRGAMSSELPGPALCLVTVREGDLEEALSSLPAPWRHVVGLVQNDLVPSQWEKHHLDPTVAVVWFEKKAGRPVTVIRPTIVGGPGADMLVAALAAVHIPAEVAVDRRRLIDALVAKNLYIGVANIAGLELAAGATVGELWAQHRSLAEGVAADVLSLQEALVGETLDRRPLLDDLAAAIAADPAHGATGRTARQRLDRALAVATDHQVAVPTMQRIAAGA